jgi:hypothetical protein
MTTLIKEVFGVRQFLGDPLEQAPSVRQVINELEAEYLHISVDAANRGHSQHVGEMVLTTVQHQRRYELGIDANEFYKVLSVSTIPADATVTGDSTSKRVTITGGDDRTSDVNMVEFERFGDTWPHLAANRGQLYGSSHDSQAIGFYKSIKPGVGEVITAELRPTPNSAQRYLILYQITDWWDSLFQSSADGANDYEFKLPHRSQRMLIRARVARNLIFKGVVKWALNDEYNMSRGLAVVQGLETRIKELQESYDAYLDTLEHGDVVYVELFGDRL